MPDRFARVNGVNRKQQLNFVLIHWTKVAKMTWKILSILCLSALILCGCQGAENKVSATPVELPSTRSAPAPISPTTTPTPPPPTEEYCENNAAFIADLTIPDFTQVSPGKRLRKSWQIRNTGSCSWGPGYYVVFEEGHAMTERLQHALYPAKPETNAVVEIEMTAPETPGEYQGFWNLYDPDGILFGHKLFIKITVVADGPNPVPE